MNIRSADFQSARLPSKGKTILGNYMLNGCKNNKNFQHRENGANRDYKVKESFSSIALSVCSVFSGLIFF